MSRAPAPCGAQETVLGVDIGTTGVKAVLLGITSGRRVATGYHAYPSTTGPHGEHEQDPDMWWDATVHAVREALSGEAARVEVSAIGLSGHMHALVLVNDDQRPVRPAMTWADRRSTPQVHRLRADADLFSARCANPVVEAFTAPKLAWVAEHEPERLQRATRLLSVKDLVRHRLTGTTVLTDRTDACGTLLYDVQERRWDDELFERCGASAALGPEVVEPREVVGTLTGAAAEALGLAPGIPVVAGAADVACSALGSGLTALGTVLVNAGTAAQVMAPMSAFVTGPYFAFARADRPDTALAMASVYAAGLSVDWVANQFGVASDEPAGLVLDRLAASAEAGASGATFVPHLLGTSVPDHDEAVRGAFLGLARSQDVATLARATLEGVAFACATAVQHVAAATAPLRELRISGGLSRSTIWARTVAAVTCVEVRRVQRDASPLGAAMLAGLGIGVWDDVDGAIRACVREEEVRAPADAERDALRSALGRYEAAVGVVTDFARRSAAGAEAMSDASRGG